MNPLVVVWRVTGRCNLRCPFCAYDRTLRFPRKHADEKLIRQFGAILSAWREHTQQPVLMSWLGGEPFLWPALVPLTQWLHGTQGIAISATTNGTTLSRESTRRHILEHYAELTISVDGSAAIHDALRGQPGLYEQLERSVKTLVHERRTAQRRLLLRVNVVLMRETIGEFPQLCRALATWGIDEITCNQLGGIDRPEFYPANRLLPDQVAQLANVWPALRDELSHHGVTLRGTDSYLQRIAASATGTAIPVEDCGPGENFLFVTEDGIASPCSFTTADYGVDLREIHSMAHLLDLPARFRRLRSRRRASACADCHSTQVCEKFSPRA